MSKNKILIVEDDNTLLEIIKYNMNKEGYLVSTADDGFKAVETAREFKPDLVILDIMLPGMNGFEVCRILRKDTNVPIIFLSAKLKKWISSRLEIGADDYLTNLLV